MKVNKVIVHYGSAPTFATAPDNERIYAILEKQLDILKEMTSCIAIVPAGTQLKEYDFERPKEKK